MQTLKMVGLSILCFIGIVVLAIITALGTLFTYFSLQIFLVGRGDYLLFVSNELNMIPTVMIMILIVYAFNKIKEKILKEKDNQINIIEEEDELVDIEKLSNLEKLLFKLLNGFVALDDIIIKIFKMIKICYIPVLIIAIYCGITSYSILYTDRIKVSSPISPKGTIYKYSDIKSVNVGVAKGRKNSYSPYYKVVLKDDRSVDFFGGTMHEDKDIGFEYTLIDLDKNLRAQGVVKSIDKENFGEYSKGLDKDFVSRVEKLLDYK